MKKIHKLKRTSVHTKPSASPCTATDEAVSNRGGVEPLPSRRYVHGKREGCNGRAAEPYNKILINHWRWLEANGYKQQAASCKLQAASLTRKLYNAIGIYRRKNYENK